MLCLREQDASPVKRLLVVGVLLLSTWVGIDGAVFGIDALARIGTANNYALESLTWYVPEFSPLWYPFIEHRHLAARDLAVVAYSVIVAAYLALPSICGQIQQASFGLTTGSSAPGTRSGDVARG